MGTLVSVRELIKAACKRSTCWAQVSGLLIKDSVPCLASVVLCAGAATTAGSSIGTQDKLHPRKDGMEQESKEATLQSFLPKRSYCVIHTRNQ